MRYMNLKKRNTSKFQYVAKQLATASMLSLVLTAVIVVPMMSNAKEVQAKNATQEVDMVNEINNNGTECVNTSDASIVIKF